MSNLKTKKINKRKAYWINYLGFWVVFMGASVVMGNIEDYDGGPPDAFSLKTGFMITSFVSAFILAHLIAKKYSKNEEIDELRIKEGLTYQEFNSKYGKLLEIMKK